MDALTLALMGAPIRAARHTYHIIGWDVAVRHSKARHADTCVRNRPRHRSAKGYQRRLAVARRFDRRAL